ncbi:MAG: hypothetical protein QHJ73_12850, partial [Armatimonadota bacterium]|nr:hypothetical protein [Armatimonadota bacterium]
MGERVRGMVVPALAMWVALAGAGGCRAESGSIGSEVAALYSIVENGGFEAGDEVPDWWARFPPQPEPWGSHRRDTRQAHSGRASGLLVSEAPHPPGKAGVQWMRYNLPVEGGCSLIVSAWVKTDGCPFSGIGCHFYDAAGGHLGFERVGARAKAEEWTYIREEVHVPAGAVKMGFALYGTDNGKTWYDDVALLRTPAAEAGRGTPVLDGKPDEACWRALGPLVLAAGEGLAAPSPKVLAAFDDRCLYLGVENAAAPRGSLEVQLSPWHRSGPVYRFLIEGGGRVQAACADDPDWRGAP